MHFRMHISNIGTASADDYMPLPGSIIMCRDRMWAKIGIRAVRSGAPITGSALVVGTLDLALPPPSLPCPSTDGRSLPDRSMNALSSRSLAIRLPSVILQMIIIGGHARRPLPLRPNGGGGHVLSGTAFSPLMFVGTFPLARQDELACATPFVPSCSWPARFRVVPPLATSVAVSMFLRGKNHRLFSSLLSPPFWSNTLCMSFPHHIHPFPLPLRLPSRLTSKDQILVDGRIDRQFRSSVALPPLGE